MIPSSANAGGRTRNPAVRLMMDVDSWLVLDETMAGIPLPTWMRPRWPHGVGHGELAAMRAGNTYVNVHTNDGAAPPNTGPGDFPGGEVRGQLLPK